MPPYPRRSCPERTTPCPQPAPAGSAWRHLTTTPRQCSPCPPPASPHHLYPVSAVSTSSMPPTLHAKTAPTFGLRAVIVQAQCASMAPSFPHGDKGPQLHPHIILFLSLSFAKFNRKGASPISAAALPSPFLPPSVSPPLTTRVITCSGARGTFHPT